MLISSWMQSLLARIQPAEDGQRLVFKPLGSDDEALSVTTAADGVIELGFPLLGRPETLRLRPA